MNISPIGQNYNYGTSKVSFKGINERKAFMTVVEGAGLKDAAYGSFLLDNKAINAYLDNCFKQLRQTFKAFKPKALKPADIRNKNERAFDFTLPDGEIITIVRGKDKKGIDALSYFATNKISDKLSELNSVRYLGLRSSEKEGDCLLFTKSIQSIHNIADSSRSAVMTDEIYDWQSGKFDFCSPETVAVVIKNAPPSK